MHVDITSLYDILGKDVYTSNLLIDIHHMSTGRMDCPDFRAITLKYYVEFDALYQKKEPTQEATLKYLIECGDLSERFVEWKRNKVDEWIQEDIVTTL